MTSAKYDFCLGQGTDLTLPFLLKDSAGTPLDLTGFQARMQLRQTYYDAEAIDTLTTDNGRIAIEAGEGRVSCSFPNSVTERYPAQKLLYDLELVEPSGTVRRIVHGTVSVTPEVTKVGSE